MNCIECSINFYAVNCASNCMHITKYGLVFREHLIKVSLFNKNNPLCVILQALWTNFTAFRFINNSLIKIFHDQFMKHI